MTLHITPREREIIADAIYHGILHREYMRDTTAIKENVNLHRIIANRYRKVLKKILEMKD